MAPSSTLFNQGLKNLVARTTPRGAASFMRTVLHAVQLSSSARKARPSIENTLRSQHNAFKARAQEVRLSNQQKRTLYKERLANKAVE
jgi:hypothetical protein